MYIQQQNVNLPRKLDNKFIFFEKNACRYIRLTEKSL